MNKSDSFGTVLMKDVLEHHGILGMKWGVRRYQNKDGSLTAAGRRRQGIISDQKNEKLENYRKRNGINGSQEHSEAMSKTIAGKSVIKNIQSTQKSKLDKAIEKDGQFSKGKTNMSRSSEPISMKKNTDDMSDSELRERIQRIKLEQEYNKLNPTAIEKGREYVDTASKAILTTAAISTAIVTIYNNADKILGVLKKVGS